MRGFLHCLTGLALLGGVVVASGQNLEEAVPEQPFPDPSTTEAPAVTDESPSQALDRLFTDLKRERRERSAARIASRIWGQWFQSGSASIDLLMQWSNDAMKEKKYAAALDFLDRVTVLKPDYAEGWNRRATVHFQMQNYSKSMADIDRTLRLEPRHFGALAGMGQILKAGGQKALALRAYERVLEVYPMLRSAQDEVATLAEELAGEGI